MMTAVVESAHLCRDADAIWREIGQVGSIDKWHPMLTYVECDGERAGALRTAEGRDGSRQTERLLESAPERHFYRYRMEATAIPVRLYCAELAVSDNADGTSTVFWSAQFHAEAADEPQAVEAVRTFFRAGLDKLKAVYAPRA
jgi:mxaD protein